MAILRFLWRFTWWRYLVLVALRHAPERVGSWLFYHTGAGESFEQLFRDLGDMHMVSRTRDCMRGLEARYG